MYLRFKYVIAAALALAFFAPGIAWAAPQDDLKSVLDRLNATSANFHSATAQVEYDSVETAPIADTDVQTGVFYFERKKDGASVGVHFDTHNGKPSGKAYTYVGGTFKLFEPGINQVTTHSGAGKYESYVVLGFGASGKDLEAKWDIKYVGSEMLSDGKSNVKTAQLELVAKDPAVRKTFSKVNIWVDTERAVSIKQVFTLSSTSTWVCKYSNFQINQSIPKDAFTFKTNGKTVYQNQ
jgi:outer membrane lipoprotein-sorting protein